MQFEQGDFSFMISAADLSINPKNAFFGAGLIQRHGYGPDFVFYLEGNVSGL